MQKVRVAEFMVLIILLVACQPSVGVSLTATSTPKPTNTPIPPTATVTPFPPLADEGPYLLLNKGFAYEKDDFVIYSGDGIGRKKFELPLDAHKGLSFSPSISPDGNWMVFFDGSIGFNGTMGSMTNPDETLPLTINILNLHDGRIIKIADIVLENYQDKQKKLAENLKNIFSDYYENRNIDEIYQEAIDGFLWGIYSTEWSPDSSYLAFAAQIDGESSDVYLYNLENHQVQRLSDDFQNVFNISWSPSGEYIVLSNQKILDIAYPTSSMHFFKLNNLNTKAPDALWEDSWGGIVEWLSEDILLMTVGTHMLGNYQLSTLDLRTGNIKILWDDLYGEAAVDYQNQVISVSTSDNSPANEISGVYFIDFNGNKEFVLEGRYSNLTFRGGKNRFLVTDYSRIFTFALDGTMTQLKYLENYDTSISPDNYWLIVFNDKEINLYDENDSFIKSFEISGVKSIIWHPDSQGVFYSTGNELYYLELQNNHPIFVDKCEIEDCYFNLYYGAVWLP